MDRPMDRAKDAVAEAVDKTREAVSDILVEALDRIEQQLKAHAVRPATHP